MNDKELKKNIIKSIIGILLTPFIFAVIIFQPAGRFDIPRAWLYIAVTFVALVTGVILLLKFNPQLITHRVQWRKKKGTKTWDKILVRAYLGIGFTVTLLVAGYDIRFQWSNLEIGFTILGLFLFVIGQVFVDWAMLANPHFEVMVRIQKDRNHQVITAGPYKFVRHPGYVGAILWNISIPLIIGSAWSLVPAVSAALLLILRTLLEDRILQRELEGYVEYTQQVKYRLLPGIW